MKSFCFLDELIKLYKYNKFDNKELLKDYFDDLLVENIEILNHNSKITHSFEIMEMEQILYDLNSLFKFENETKYNFETLKNLNKIKSF